MKDNERQIGKLGSWGAIPHHLGQDGKSVSDRAFGEGVMLVVPSDETAESPKAVGVFEVAKSIRIKTRSGVDIRIPDLAEPVFREHDVSFANNAGDAGVQTRKNGEIWIRLPAVAMPLESP